MKHKKIYKRLIAFLMAFIMFFTNPFQGISSGTKVKALEYAIGSEAISEVVLLLYSFNLVAAPMGIIVPINLVTVISLVLLGVPALFSFILIIVLMF